MGGWEVPRDPTKGRYGSLKQWLRDKEPLIAFSGGVDSTLLAYSAHVICPRYLAVTIRSPLCPSWEADEAPRIASQLGLRHRVISVDILSNRKVASNPRDRCYHCKKMILTKLIELAGHEGLDVVIDGTNADDLKVYRPGRSALVELGVASPLADAGLSKDDIRRISKMLELPTWNKEPMPCLATRIPYGERLEPARLAKIDRAESFIREMGFRIVRVRDQRDVARIEIGRREFKRIKKEDFLSRVGPYLRDLGYTTIDLGAYKSGRWDDKAHECP